MCAGTIYGMPFVVRASDRQSARTAKQSGMGGKGVGQLQIPTVAKMTPNMARHWLMYAAKRDLSFGTW
jgi:hypothetical protein